MSQNNNDDLTLVIDQVRQEVSIDSQGKGKATIRATARLVGVNDMSISKALNTADLNPSKLAKHLIEQGFEGADQTEWKTEGIPDIAIASIAHYYAYEAGRYTTEQAKLVCKAFTAIGIRSWMQQIAGWTPQPTSTPTPQEINQTLDLIFGGTDLDPQLIAGVKCNAISTTYPQLKATTDIAKQALSIPVKEELLRPTAIAQKLEVKTDEKWSPVKVNKTLILQGFQERNPDGNPNYLPTEKGKPYSKLVLDTAKGRSKTVQSLLWYPSIVEAIEVVEGKN